jgi:hypothetical protein
MTYFLNLRQRPAGSGIRDTVGVNNVTLVGGRPVVANPDPLASELANAALGKNVIFATHGFNVNQEDGFTELANWETLLQFQPQSDGFLFVGIVWPGDSSWLGPLSYPGEGTEAMKCGDLLGAFISDNFKGAGSLSFVSHSLGARFLLQTITSLDAAIPVRQVGLMAGAINDDCLTGEYQAAATRCGKIDILASEKDEVLAAAFPIGNIFEGIIDKGHPYWRAALGHDGPRTIIPGKGTGAYQIPSNWDFGHGNYIEDKPPLNPPLPLPQDVPPAGWPPPTTAGGWRPSWAAAFVTTRFR